MVPPWLGVDFFDDLVTFWVEIIVLYRCVVAIIVKKLGWLLVGVIPQRPLL